jgi:hypothetical protein
MMLIALVGVGGFTALAQRRLRSIGMLGAHGATNAALPLVRDRCGRSIRSTVVRLEPNTATAQ